MEEKFFLFDAVRVKADNVTAEKQHYQKRERGCFLIFEKKKKLNLS
jgi:hypothetical protein